jgi:ubiquinone/menaquinone biosynthesis C-methylase UbiE
MLAYHLNKDIDVSSRNHAFIEQSVHWINNRFSLSSGMRVCDFGCGPGLYTRQLAETGASITGIDFSQHSLDYARTDAAARGLTIQYLQGNYLDIELDPHFDLITMIMCDFCALSPVQRKKLLATFHRLLSSGGKVLLDVYSTVMFNQKIEAAYYEKNQLNHFWYQEDYYGFVNTFKYEPDNVLLDKYSLFSESGKQEVVYNWLQCFDLATLANELNASGFRVIEQYGNVRGSVFDADSTEFAVVIEKL